MKNFKFILCILFLFITKSPAYSQNEFNQYADIVVQINNHWTDKSHLPILQIIEGRLSENADDVFALLLKRYYYTFAECDLPKARIAVDKLHDVVNALGDNSLTTVVLGLKNETYGIPLNESVPFTQNEVEAIHNIFPNRFPGIDLCEAISLESDTFLDLP